MYRTDNSGEVGNQPVHMPGILPKLPGRFYYLFGKPIDTQGTYVYPRKENYFLRLSLI